MLHFVILYYITLYNKYILCSIILNIIFWLIVCQKTIFNTCIWGEYFETLNKNGSQLIVLLSFFIST